MTWRAYSSGNDIIPGKWCAGQRGLGVLAETVPSLGTSGAGVLFPSLVFPTDTGVEVRAELITPPGSGTLQLFDDSTAIYTNPTPGIYSLVFKYWRAGVDQGNATAYFTLGESCSVNVIPQTVLDFSGGAGTVPAASFSGAVNALAFSGGSQTSPLLSCALAGAVNALAFSGSAGTAPSIAFSGVVSALGFDGFVGGAPSMATLQASIDTFTFEGYAGHPFDSLSPTQMTRPIIDFTILSSVRVVDQLAAKDPAETILLECYFDLPAGVGLAGGSFSFTVETSVAGIADDPLEFIGTARTYGRRVQQLVRKGTNLTRYRIRCSATSLPSGLVMVQTGVLPVVSQ